MLRAGNRHSGEPRKDSANSSARQSIKNVGFAVPAEGSTDVLTTDRALDTSHSQVQADDGTVVRVHPPRPHQVIRLIRLRLADIDARGCL